MREDHPGEVDAVPLPAEVKEPEEVLEENRSLLDVGRAVIEDLREVGVEADESPIVPLEEEHGVELVLGRFLGSGVL